MTSIYSKEYNAVIQFLITARNNAKFTQQQLADKLHKPQSFISKYEKGERRLDIVEFVQICKILKADYKELLDSL